MTVKSGVQALRRGWLLVLVGVLAGVLGGAAVSVLTPSTYAARASVYVSEVTRAEGSGSGIPSMLFTQRLTSYQQMITSERVLGPAAQRLAWRGDPKALASGLSVGAQAGSTVLVVSVSGSDPTEVASRANAITDAFVDTVGAVERVPGSTSPPGVLATVVDRATPRATPIGTPASSNLVLGAAIGLLAGVVWVLGRAAVDTSVRSPEALGSATGRPVLGVLPRRRGAGAPGLGDTRDGPFEDAARRLRDQLALGEADGGARTLAFCAARAGAGATTVVAALAGTLARTGSVVVVDANLRAPGLAGILGCTDGPGLSDLLGGGTGIDDVVQTADGVDVIVAGTAAADPGALLGSRRLGRILDELRGRYDRVVVDCSAVGPTLDGALVARRVDGTVLVAREGSTGGDELAAAMSALGESSASVLGAVLTGSRHGVPSTPGSTVRHDPPTSTDGPSAARLRPAEEVVEPVRAADAVPGRT